MENKIRIAIADDHNLFRKGIAALLSDFDFIGEVTEAANGKELIDTIAASEHLPEVILLDVNMPVMDGVEAQKRIRVLYPEIKIIILTMEDDEQFIVHLINEGVNGYLLKNANPDEMEKAIKKVVEHGFYFSENISELVLKSLHHREKNRFEIREDFTENELRVLQLICLEKTTAEIADELNTSSRTIDGYRRKLLEKTGAKNMAGLVLFAVKNGIFKV